MELYGDYWLEIHQLQLDRRLADQMAALKRQINPQTAENVADVAQAYPTWEPELAVGAGLAGVTPGSPVAQEIAYRRESVEGAEERSFWDNVGGFFGDYVFDPLAGIFRMPGVVLEPVTRTAFTAFDMMWEEAFARPFKTIVASMGLADGHGMMSPWNAWKEAGTSYGSTALRKIVSGDWRDINLGSGYIPRSDMAEDTEEYKNRVARGETPEDVRAEIQTRLGDPIVQQSWQQREKLKVMGQPISPGRLAVAPLVALDRALPGGTFIEQGGTAYNTLTGMLDAAVALSTMRVGRIPGKVPGRFGARVPFVAGKKVPFMPEEGLTVTKRLAGRPVPLPGDPAATVLKHVGVMRRASKMFDTISDDAFAAAMKAQGLSPISTGLVKWIRRSVHSPTADEWLQSPLGRQLSTMIDTDINPDNMAMLVDWFTRTNPHLPRKFFDDLARSGRGGGLRSAEDIMREAINTKRLHAIPTVVGPMSPFRGTFSRQLGGALARTTDPGLAQISRQLGELGGFRAGLRSGLDTYGWGRLFREMNGRFIDIEDADQGFYDLNKWMISAGTDVRKRSEILHMWVDEVSGEFSNIAACDVAAEAFDEYAKRLNRLGMSGRLTDYLTEVFHDGQTMRKFFTDETVSPFWAPGTRMRVLDDAGKEVTVAASPTELSEFLDRAIPLPDAREMRKAQSTMRRWLGSSRIPREMEQAGQGARMWLRDFGKGERQILALNENAVQRTLDLYTQKFWKPMTLLRVAWPIRVIGEEQFRGAAGGLDSLVNHPIRAITWMISDPNANRFTRALQTLGIKPRGRMLTDLKLTDPHDLDELADLMKANGITDDDIIVALQKEFEDATHMVGDMFTGIWRQPAANQVWGELNKVGRHGAPDAGFAEGVFIELRQMARDPVTRIIAAEGEAAAVRWLRGGKGRDYRRDLARRIQDRTGRRQAQLRADESVEAIVKSKAARLRIKTGGHAHLGILDPNAPDGVRWVSGTRSPKALSQADAAILEDPLQYHRLHLELEDIPAEKIERVEALRQFVATGRWKGVGDVVGGYRNAQLSTIAQDLTDNYLDVLPNRVKGLVPSKIQNQFGEGYEKVVRWMFDHLMTVPTGTLSRSPAFKQFIWQFLGDSVGFASPSVQRRVLQAARNADLPKDMMRTLEVRMAAAQGSEGYGILNDTMQARADKIIRVSELDDEQLIRAIQQEGILDEVAVGVEDLEEWMARRVARMDDDTLTDGDLALFELWHRHNAEGYFSGNAIEEINQRVAKVYGIDVSDQALQNRKVLDMRAADQSFEEIAASFGVSPSTARRWHKRAVAALQENPQARAAYLKDVQGYTWKQVADELGIHPSTAQRWAKAGRKTEGIEEMLGDDLDSLWRLMENDGARYQIEDHFDRHTDFVDGVRRPISAHGFEDVTTAKGEFVRDGFEELIDLAKAHALEDVQGLLYDTAKRHHIMDMLRNFFPFGQAWIEVLSTWAKLLVRNPQVVRRGQQLIEGARKGGFFFTDPSTGEEVFNYPLSGALFNMASNTEGLPSWAGAAMSGLGGAGGFALGGAPGGILGGAAGGGLSSMLGGGGMLGGDPGDPSFRYQGSVAGLNLFAGSYSPGFGPVVQIAASHLFADDPSFDAIRELVLPFGDQRLQEPGDLLDLTLPRWATRFLGAVGLETPEQKRIFGNTTIDVYKTLILAQGEPETQQQAEQMLRRAKDIAGKLSLYRSFAYFFAPAAPQMRFDVRDKDGDLWLFQSLASEYRRILYETHNGDDVAAYDEFVRTFGLDPTLFATSKSTQIAPRNVTDEGDRWARENRSLFEKAPATAYFAHPDDPTDESFNYEAYVRQLAEGAREPLDPDQWWAKRNDTLGRVIYEKTRREMDDQYGFKPHPIKTIKLRFMRHWIMDRFPGYKQPIPGAPQKYSLDMKIRELRQEWLGQDQGYYWEGSIKWEGDMTGGEPRLRESETGQALQLWFKAVDSMETRALNKGLTPGGLWTAKMTIPEREILRRYAAHLMERYPEFTFLYRMVLEHQFTEDDFGLSFQSGLGLGAGGTEPRMQEVG
jgi:transposase